MSIIFEVLNAIILIGEEIVGDSDIESTSGVGNGKVELLGVIRICDAVATPSTNAKTIIANTESWLYASFSELLTTPELVGYYISPYTNLYFILCVCYAYAQHSGECKSHYLECSHNLFPFFCVCNVPAGYPSGNRCCFMCVYVVELSFSTFA